MKNLIHPEPAMMRVRKHPVQRSIFTLGLALLFALSLSAQITWHVAAAVQGGGQTGQDWPNAFSDLQSALALAQSGDAIWVAQGTYYPTATADRSISFALKPGVRLYGGFAGAETELSQRDFDQHPSVLSGNIGSATTHKDNSYNIVTGQDLDSTSCLDGFVLEYAYAETGQGGAVLLTASGPSALCRPAIRNCRFAHNYANKGAGLNCFWNGSGVVSPVLTNCTFEFNEARNIGGAVYKNGPSPNGRPFVATQCIFKENRISLGGFGGAGIYLDGVAGKTILHACRFERDSAPGASVGAGLYIQSALEPSELHIDSSVFLENLAAGATGIAYEEISSSMTGVFFTCHMDDCVFERNISTNGSAAVFEFLGYRNSIMELHMNRCRIIDNVTWSLATCMFYGGEGCNTKLSVRNSQFIGNRDVENTSNTIRALHYGVRGTTTSDAPDGRCQATIANCVFARNSAGIKAEGYQAGNRVTSALTNCTFYRNGLNIVQKDWRPGFNDSSWYNNMTVSNCIFEENTPSWWLFSNNYTTEWRMDGYKIDYVAVKGDVFKLGSIGPHALYNKDPMFADTAVNDFRLRPCSPAVNYGSNLAADAAGLVMDLDGNPRIFDGTVDLGAYEAQDTCGMVPVTELAPDLAAIVLFPNPVTAGSPLTLRGDGATGVLQWQLYNAHGQLQASGECRAPGCGITAPATPGVYWLAAGDRRVRRVLRVVVI